MRITRLATSSTRRGRKGEDSRLEAASDGGSMLVMPSATLCSQCARVWRDLNEERRVRLHVVEKGGKVEGEHGRKLRGEEATRKHRIPSSKQLRVVLRMRRYIHIHVLQLRGQRARMQSPGQRRREYGGHRHIRQREHDLVHGRQARLRLGVLLQGEWRRILEGDTPWGIIFGRKGRGRLGACGRRY